MTTSTLNGYSETKQYAAQQSMRAGKTVYTITMPLMVVPIHLPVPDPSKPYEFNRQVDKGRSQKFADYWESHPDSWAVPPLLIDSSNTYLFDPKFDLGENLKLGVLHLPEYATQELRILDGQHRILGWSMARNGLLERQSKLIEDLAKMAKNGATALEVSVVEAKLATVKSNVKRLLQEQVTVEIITGVSLEDHKTYFVTIAENAKGINKAERVRLDENTKVSRVAKKLATEHPLLIGYVEDRRTTVGKGGKNLMTLANLADIVRHSVVGISGKISLGREVWLPESKIEVIASHFLNALMENVAHFNKLASRTTLAQDIRAGYLWGSPTILRTLSGAYFELAVSLDDSTEEITWIETGHKKFVDLLLNLKDSDMKIRPANGNAPRLDSKWYDTQLIPSGSIAPGSRAQDLKALTGLFVAWANSGEAFNPKTN